jgi:hypothetical protein
LISELQRAEGSGCLVLVEHLINVGTGVVGPGIVAQWQQRVTILDTCHEPFDPEDWHKRPPKNVGTYID